jgi:two-component system, NtrC family, sensor histidine kinase HydH
MSDAPPSILVVDDEEMFLSLYVDILQDEGYSVATARNGREALERVEKESFQLVLSDIQMPELDGLGLLKAVRAAHADVEVVLMTAYGGLQSVVQALRLGAYDYIVKPFPRDVLVATVHRALEKQRLARELRMAQAELIKREKLAAMGSVSGWLAHRMRNPLNVILMCAQYLRARFDGGDERQEVALAIEEKVRTLEEMTRDFIRFSRSYQPALSEDSLPEVVEQALHNVSSGRWIKSITVEKNFEPGLPSVALDRGLLGEALDNLLNNALEAMEGSGTLRVDVRRGGRGVLLDISNTGRPMPEDVRRRIFDPFFTTKENGTGLGLAIVRRVVESHGGQVSVLPEERTTFRIELPAAAAGAAKDEND